MILNIAVYYISSKSVEKASTQQLVLESVFCSPEINILGYHLLWPFRSVAILVCGRFGLWPFDLWPFRSVAVSVMAGSVCGRYDMLPYSQNPGLPNIGSNEATLKCMGK